MFEKIENEGQKRIVEQEDTASVGGNRFSFYFFRRLPPCLFTVSASYKIQISIDPSVCLWRDLPAPE